MSVDLCRVALLGRDDGAREQLRQALQERGATVVFEGEPGSTSESGVFNAGPSVVIVNLQEGADDDLDHLQAVFDSPDISVVFNDADVSQTLEGWDLARWARHLVAKVLGHGDTMPPLPEGARRLVNQEHPMPRPGAVPGIEQPISSRDAERMVAEAAERIEEVPMATLAELPDAEPFEASLPSEDTGSESVPQDESWLDVDLDQLDDALGLTDAPAPELLASTPEPVDSGHLADVVVDTPEAVELYLDEADPAPAVLFEAEVVVLETSTDDLTITDDAVADAGVDTLLGDDFSLEAALGLTEYEPVPALAEAPPPQDHDHEVSPSSIDSEAPAAEESFDDVDFDWAFDEVSNEQDDVAATSPSEAPLQEESIEIDFESWSVDALVEPAADSDTAPESAASLELGSFVASEDPPTVELQAWALDDIGDASVEPAALDDEVAALAAQLDAFEAPQDDGEAVELDFSAMELIVDDSPEPHGDAADEAPQDVAPSEGSVGEDSLAAALGLSLAPLDDGAEEEGQATAAPAAKPAFDFSNLDKFSLEPLEGEGDAADPLMVAMGLADAPPVAAVTATAATAADESPLGHIFVLGASIGGPDAVRTFLSELPEQMPAVFLLAQHLESGYFERLAQQLQKASALPVRIASAGSMVKQGEVLVIPAAEHIVLEVDGSIGSSPHETPPRYTPSIDDVLRDVADRFGAGATAIIFSGMAGDAVEGAAYLTTKGGEVWAQDPESCVVSSMVDGARARGVVEFTGSPRELAQRCVARLARRGNNR